MAEKGVVTFLGEWQTGAFLLFGSALVGLVFGGIVGTMRSGFFGAVSFGVSAVSGSFLLSYSLYGR